MKKTSMEMEHSGKLKITAFHFTHSERQLPELPTLSVLDISSFFFSGSVLQNLGRESEKS